MKAGETLDDASLVELGREVIDIEASAVRALAGRVDEAFVRACRYCLGCEGRVVVTGMGKSGHIAGKIAATLASTGTPAFFLHPGEATHGDLGRIVKGDVLLALSHSGDTEELRRLRCATRAAGRGGGHGTPGPPVGGPPPGPIRRRFDHR